MNSIMKAAFQIGLEVMQQRNEAYQLMSVRMMGLWDWQHLIRSLSDGSICK